MNISTLVLTVAVLISQQDAGEKKKLTPEEIQKIQAERFAEQAKKNARVTGKIVKPGISYFTLSISDPITKSQLAHLGYILELSDAQMKQFDALHEVYLDDGWAYREPNVQPIYDRSAELAAMETRYTPEWAEQMQELRADVDLILPTLRAMDYKLIEAMQPYLSDDQVPLVSRAKKLRERQCFRVERAMYLGGRFDLTETLFEFSKKDYDMTPNDRDRFDEVVREYEDRLTSLWKQFFDYVESHREESSRLSSEMQALNKKPQDGSISREEIMQLAAPLSERRRDIQLQRHQLERRLHELNERHIGLFAELLPDETSSDWQKWWREKIYRYVYPDPYDLESFLLQASAIENLTDDQRVSIESIAIEYHRRQDTLSQSMLREFNVWNDDVSAKAGYNPDEYQEYAKRMRALQGQRHENADKSIEAVRLTLDDQQIASLTNELEAYSQHVEEFDEQSKDHPQYGPMWPGPWANITD